MRMLLSLLLLLLPAVALAGAGPLPVPQLEAGEHVYTIPTGLATADASKPAQRQLNERLKKAPYPTLVVIADKIPPLTAEHRQWAQDHGYLLSNAGGDQNKFRGRVAVGMLIDDLSAEYSEFDAGRTSVFLLSYDPRYFALEPGKQGKAAGIHSKNTEPYTQLFKSKARTNPLGGVGDALVKVSTDIYQKTDPELLEKRRIQREKQLAAQRLKVAKADLSREISDVERTLSATEYLPANVSVLREALSEARATLNSKASAGTYMEAAHDLEVAHEPVKTTVTEARSAASLERVLKAVGSLLGFAFIVFVFRRIRGNYLDYTSFRERILGRCYAADQDVSNAKAQWASNYLNVDREKIVDLAVCTGETLALYQETTQAVDAVRIRIDAMERNTREVRAIVKKASWFNQDPLNQASNQLLTSFEFDTQEVNTDDLFGTETRKETVDPARFKAETARLFRLGVSGWAKLTEAVGLRFQPAEELCPSEVVEDAFVRLNRASLPLDWAGHHPLAGDDEQDQAFWDGLNAVRQDDPVQYKRLVAEFKEAERALDNRVTALIDLKARSGKWEASVPDLNFPGITLSKKDDPSSTLVDAREAADVFFGLLQDTTSDFDSIEAAFDDSLREYSRVRRQAGTVRSAMERVDARQAEMTKREETVDKALSAMGDAISDAAKVHSNYNRAWSHYESAEEALANGRRHLRDAERLAGNGEVVEATRFYESARVEFDASMQEIGKSRRALSKLEAARQEFTRLRSQMRNNLQAEQRRMGKLPRRYRTSFSAYSDPTVNGPANYSRLNRDLEQVQSDWRLTYRRAKKRYDHDLAVEAARQAAARRAEAARQAAARAARAASRSSSSSSSWGGGGFSGGDGGFSGGGFSGGDGSW